MWRLYLIEQIQLAVKFVQSSYVPQICWSMVRNGIALAMDVGAHRRKVYDAKPSVDEELWKRAFWYVVAVVLRYAVT